MIGNRDLFAPLDNSELEVKLGNDNKVFVMGKGVINLFKKHVETRFIQYTVFLINIRNQLQLVLDAYIGSISF